MAGRYDIRKILVNNNEQYSEIFRERNVNFIRQHAYPKFKYPTSEQIQELDVIGHIWALGDSFWKLSEKYYGDAEYWWIIAFYNLKIEQQLKFGDSVYIPLPLDKILKFIEV